MIAQMAANNMKINNKLQPLQNGYLGEGKFAFTWKGILEPIQKEIGMKFTISSQSNMASREYEMYTYLHAINNETVEAYGIPAIYYFGPCLNGNFIVMGMTLLDSAFQEQIKKGFSEIDVLMIFREFVSIFFIDASIIVIIEQCI